LLISWRRAGKRSFSRCDGDLQLYAGDLERRGLSRSSCNRKVDAIKTFFRFLAEQEIVAYDPAEQLIPPLAIEREPRILTEDEYQRLIATCAHHPRDHTIIVLYLQTGIRLSELVRLKLTDIELPQDISQDAEQSGFARITRSNGRTERIPLNYKACQPLIAYLTDRPASPYPTLFLNRFDAPLSKRRVQYLVQEYLEHNGTEGFAGACTLGGVVKCCLMPLSCLDDDDCFVNRKVNLLRFQAERVIAEKLTT